jgi:hypothetical protein
MNFIVEHLIKGHYAVETIRNVEDLDTSRFVNILGIWITDSEEETQIMEKELKEMRGERSSKPSEALHQQ